MRLSSDIRDLAGPGYPLGAIVPSPVRLRDDLAYWPGFPWHELALTYDAILPMTYFTFRADGPAETAATSRAASTRSAPGWGATRSRST